MKSSNSVRGFYKTFLNTTLENVIQLVYLVAVFKETKDSLV